MHIFKEPYDFMAHIGSVRGLVAFMNCLMWFGNTTILLMAGMMGIDQSLFEAAEIDGATANEIFWKITLPMISPMLFYLIITGFIGAFKAYSDAVALFGTNLNAAEMNTIVGYVYDMLYGDSGGYPSYASAAAIILFAIVLTITCINLLVSKKKVHY
jgi:multiple sugar transport system permease protein